MQNVAPREQMGAATSSTIFFRSIGSTVGVAIFGSMMLTRYHAEFERSDAGARARSGAAVLLNPLLLVQVRPQLEAAFGAVPGGAALLQTLFVNVRTALDSGLHLVFFWAAIIMGVSMLVHLMLRSEPLRTRVAQPEMPSH